MPLITYNGPSSAAVFAVGVINSAFDVATEKMAQTTSYANQAITAATLTVPTLTGLTMPTVDTSVATSNTDAKRAALLSEMSQGQQTIFNDLVATYEGFLTNHFKWGPEFDAAQAWVHKALTTGGTGLNANIEAQIWERDRSRMQREAARAEEEATALWASKRYPLPPGAAAHQVLLVQQNLRDNLAQSSREVAIKQAEMELENIKSAIGTVVDVQKTAMNMAIDYVKQMTFAYTFPAEKAIQSAQAVTAIEQAATAYYQAQVGLKELVLKSAITAYEVQARFVETKAKIELEYVGKRVEALTAAMQSAGVQAASALNSLHASSGYTGSELV